MQATLAKDQIITDWYEIFEKDKTPKEKLADIQFNVKEITDIIKASKPTSSPGVYQITNVICKEMKEILAPILCTIYNKALAERKPVYEIINVIVTLLYKGGSRMELTNYRPVSL